MRKTKIICTVGPSLNNKEIIKKAILSGMDVARLNFSHGTHEEHLGRVNLIKDARAELDTPTALLLDTKGPEIRTGKFKDEPVELKAGQIFSFFSHEILGDSTKCSVSYVSFHKDLAVGNKILVDDGLIEMVVSEIINDEVKCIVKNEGRLSSNKGINLPDIFINLPPLTEKDIEDIHFAVENDFDFIAASFVRKASDIINIRKVLDGFGGNGIYIIAKLENREGVQNYKDILKVADGIMVARGDLGVEIPLEEVPVVQKKLIKYCYKIGKPCIIATQMLDSMSRNPRPTRAEVSDVANAVFDGTSAVMLSGETAAGKYPLDAISVMTKIILSLESSIDYRERFYNESYEMVPNISNAISHSSVTSAIDLNAACIVVVTYSGHTARQMSRFRPSCPIIAATVVDRSRRQLNLNWGVKPYLVAEVENIDEVFKQSIQTAQKSGFVENGDIIVMAGGTPTGVTGTTNTIQVLQLGKVLVQGKGLGKGRFKTEALVFQSNYDLNIKVSYENGYILICKKTDHTDLAIIKDAQCVIVEDDDPSSHTAIVCLTLGIPIVYGCHNATGIIKNKSIISVDIARGIVS